MKALISPIEIREQGYRVAETHETGFEVALPYFWVDCDETLIADSKWYDPTDNTFKDFPLPPQINQKTEDQPITSGTQEI